MLQTYKAVLRGDRLEWSGETPPQVESEQPVDVHVTILQDADVVDDRTTRGKKMAEDLEKLAAINAFPDITDPSAWQREQREERSMWEDPIVAEVRRVRAELEECNGDFHELFRRAVEFQRQYENKLDDAMVRAIEEGMQSGQVSREEVFAIIEGDLKDD